MIKSMKQLGLVAAFVILMCAMALDKGCSALADAFDGPESPAVAEVPAPVKARTAPVKAATPAPEKPRPGVPLTVQQARQATRGRKAGMGRRADMGNNVDLCQMLNAPKKLNCQHCGVPVSTYFDDYDIECGNPNPAPGQWRLRYYCPRCEYDSYWGLSIGETVGPLDPGSLERMKARA